MVEHISKNSVKLDRDAQYEKSVSVCNFYLPFATPLLRFYFGVPSSKPVELRNTTTKCLCVHMLLPGCVHCVLNVMSCAGCALDAH